MHAADLFQAGKVKWIFVPRGNLPWSPGERSEAELIGEFLQRWGVPRTAIILEKKSRTTRENAAGTQHAWRAHGFESALLVTSAFHMRRALATFKAAGVQVSPSSTDIYVTWPIVTSVLDVLPNSRSLEMRAIASKEVAGYVFYRVQGWL